MAPLPLPHNKVYLLDFFRGKKASGSAGRIIGSRLPNMARRCLLNLLLVRPIHYPESGVYMQSYVLTISPRRLNLQHSEISRFLAHTLGI
jgi:hypothetical protein